MNGLLRTLLTRFVSDDARFYALEEASLPWDCLEKQGYIKPSDPITYTGCQYGNEAEVVWVTLKQGENIPCLCCACCGMNRIHPDQTRSWTLRIEPVLEQVVQKLEIRGIIQELVPGSLWKLGRKRAKEFLYLRRLHTEQRRLIVSELLKVPSAMIVAGTREVLKNLQREMIDNDTLALDQVATLNDHCEMIIDREMIHDMLGDNLGPVKKTVPAASHKRGSRAARIEKLVCEMKEHLKAAKEYARTTAKQGEMQLLPRPTLQELSNRTGIEKSVISRCLKDPNAQVLRVLWEEAIDLKMIFR